MASRNYKHVVILISITYATLETLHIHYSHYNYISAQKATLDGVLNLKSKYTILC